MLFFLFFFHEVLGYQRQCNVSAEKDWDTCCCDKGDKLLLGGCHAMSPPYTVSASYPGHCGSSLGWVCGGFRTQKVIFVTCEEAIPTYLHLSFFKTGETCSSFDALQNSWNYESTTGVHHKIDANKMEVCWKDEFRHQCCEPLVINKPFVSNCNLRMTRNCEQHLFVFK